MATNTKKKSPTKKKTATRRNTTKTPARRSTKQRSSRKRSNRTAQPLLSLNRRQVALISGLALCLLAVVTILSLLSANQGALMSFVSLHLRRAFGLGGYFFPLAMGAAGFYLVLWGMDESPTLPGKRLGGALALFLTFEAFATMTAVRAIETVPDRWAAAALGAGGGYLGALLATATEPLGSLASIFLFLAIGIVGATFALGVTKEDFARLQRRLQAMRPAARPSRSSPLEREIIINNGRATLPVQPPLNLIEDFAEAEAPPPPAAEPPRTERRPRQRPTPPPQLAVDETPPPSQANRKEDEGPRWELPKMAEILESGGQQELNSASVREQVEVIEHTLESFGAPANVVEINQGPTITQFGVEPQFIETRSGRRTKVKVGKIASLADDLALALAARSIRIQAPVPGRGYVGIEVPNSTKALVSLRDVMESPDFNRIKSPLRIALGQNVAGQAMAADLAAMPHLLIAGTTGAGKSICINAIITCLLLQNTPDQLKLVLVDPKRVELTGYNGIPHLAAPVVMEMERVIGVLQWAMREMDNRYKLFAGVGTRNIIEYNKKIAGMDGRERLPYVVIIIDELADLMMMSPEDTERGITRLAQLARATGIHLIIATQRPSVDVVTGLIKANFPARIAFAVASSTDSRVILDTTGAERLLGQGDMLFQSPDAAAPVRMQGCFVSEGEIAELIGYWQTARRFHLIRPQSPPSRIVEEPSETLPASASNGEVTEPATELPETLTAEVIEQPLWEEAEDEATEQYEDDLMPEAIKMVRELDKASTSLLQRRFRIGYTRAARLIDAMEDAGIIGPPTGNSKAREVLPWQAEAEGDASSDE